MAAPETQTGATAREGTPAQKGAPLSEPEPIPVEGVQPCGAAWVTSESFYWKLKNAFLFVSGPIGRAAYSLARKCKL
jgi:hypothetical protein